MNSVLNKVLPNDTGATNLSIHNQARILGLSHLCVSALNRMWQQEIQDVRSRVYYHVREPEGTWSIDSRVA